MSEETDCPSAAPTKPNLRFTIPSDFKFSCDVQQQIMAEVDKHGYCESARFAIMLALEEAIVNAIKHGNQFDIRKSVYIEADVTAQSTRITVEDEGPGFDRCSVPDPRARENLEKCSGRGILLIEAYMTRVEWTNKGKRLTMYRVNEPDAEEAVGCVA